MDAPGLYVAFLQYKRDTEHLIYWMVQTSNSILAQTGDTDSFDHTASVTVTKIITLAELISKHLFPAPVPVLKLFRSIICNRTTVHNEYRRLATEASPPSYHPATNHTRHSSTHSLLLSRAWAEKLPLSRQKNATAQKIQSYLTIFHKANWDFEEIPLPEIVPFSGLAAIRLAATKKVLDPATGKLKLEDNDLVQRYRRVYTTRDWYLMFRVPKKTANKASSTSGDDTNTEEALTIDNHPNSASRGFICDRPVSDYTVLDTIKLDLIRDVCGTYPLSAHNFLQGIAHMIREYDEIEQILRNVDGMPSRTAVKRERSGQDYPRQAQLELVKMGLDTSENAACLTKLVGVFRGHGRKFSDEVYWGELLQTLEVPKTMERRAQEEASGQENLGEGCVLM